MDGGRAHWMTLPNWVIHLKYNLYYIICYILYRTIHIYIYIYKDIPSPNDMLRHLGPFMVEENHQRVTSTRWWWWQPAWLKKTHQRVVATRWWWWEPVWLKKNHQRVAVTRWWWWQLAGSKKTHLVVGAGVVDENPPTSHSDSLVVVGASGRRKPTIES